MSLEPSSGDVERPVHPLRIAAVASLSAGAVHAAAIGAHADSPQAARVFVYVALFQIAWAAAALARPHKWVAFVGAVGNFALLGGWVLAKTQGLNFISGLDSVEPIQVADGLAAALAAIATIAATYVFLSVRPRRQHPMLSGAVVAALAVSMLPGMVQAGNHTHTGSSHGSIIVGADGKATLSEAPVALPTKPFDPTLPIDLSGVPNVTPQQQARAENVLAETLMRLPQWADSATAEAAGYHSIGDAGTGDEHLINWSYIDDGKTLDPDHPEALVYNVRNGSRQLEAAMYMLPTGSTLNSVPDIGGALTQWHIHDNLCFSNDPVAPQVRGLTNSSGGCSNGLVKFVPVPMIHVWIIANPCGPFAALEGVGAGQTKPGEVRNCDHVHGSNTIGF
ncbi:MAG: hypothetical protein QOJ67_2145 [Acidimicrobiaceae bacterium]|jgi:hypothetical protein